MPEDIGQQAAQAAPIVKPVTIEVDGKPLEFVPKTPIEVELAKSYMRRTDYVQKRQIETEEKRRLQQEVEALRGTARPHADPNARYGSPTGVLPGTVGGDRFANPTYPDAGYPAIGTPYAAAPTVSPPAGFDPDEPATQGDIVKFSRAVASETEGRLARQVQVVSGQLAELATERALSAMEKSPHLPGFDRLAVEETYTMMPDSEKVVYEGLPRPYAYELIYHRYIRPQVSQAAPPPSGKTDETNPPFSEGTQAAGVDLGPPPDLTGPVTRENASRLMDGIRRRQDG